ncbi:MAG: polysaccharide biosynthesis protein [Clostridia bacterium]|nr:polysaccharide biosynthesis protein [Clostridia bacterium]
MKGEDMRTVFSKSGKIRAFLFDLLCFLVINTLCALGTLVDGAVDARQSGIFMTNLTVLAVLVFTFRTLAGIYKKAWRYTSAKTYICAIVVDTVAAAVGIILTSAVRGEIGIWYFVTVLPMFTLLDLTVRCVFSRIRKRDSDPFADELLLREQLNINSDRTLGYYKDKTVLVTGGGGSIGSEICRQIARCSPKKLIVLDIYENNAYDIQQELLREHGDRLDLAVVIASVRDADRLDRLFEKYRPNVVFHAAAHKHVPLMENDPSEAIKNNVIGTYNTANAAERFGVQKFIMISTDKAVNPTSIMGATKRVCEMIVQCRIDSATCFASVRFGNVLGSNGSVVPLFKSQIASGGPITLTDKRVVRYFMTIPEASQLVIEAGAMAKQGQLFVLDMGQPVNIYDLAVNMIKLYGLVPERDIKIEEIGLRPGEKLYEELLISGENIEKTDNDLIFVETDTPYTREQIDQKIDILLKAMESHREKDIFDAMKKVVPTFCKPNETAE